MPQYGQLNRGRVLNPRRVLNRGQVLNRRRRGRRRRRYPDVKANCFDVKCPKGESEKRVKRRGRREIGDRISRSLDVCGP